MTKHSMRQMKKYNKVERQNVSDPLYYAILSMYTLSYKYFDIKKLKYFFFSTFILDISVNLK